MAYTLATNSLGSVTSIKMQKMERGDVYGIPFSDSSATYVYSFDGVERRISITGVFTGTLTAIDTWIDTIEALVDGAQGAGSGYTFATGTTELPKSQSYTVHLEDFTYDWLVDDGLTSVKYTMKMIQRV